MTVQTLAEVVRTIPQPPSPIRQLLVVGGTSDRVGALASALQHDAPRFLHLNPADIESEDWQLERGDGPAWAVLIVPDNSPESIQDVARWTQLVSLSFRPTRLVVMMPWSRLDVVLRLTRLGADGIVPDTATPDELLAELNAPPIRANDYFPDPGQWLGALRRASEELLADGDAQVQMRRLLHIFRGQLKVDRASVMLLEGDNTLRVQAGIGLPESVKVGDLLPVRPGSIASWVIQNRRSRLIEGRAPTNDDTQGLLQSAICAPLISEGRLLGVVSFSCLNGGRWLMPADLATAEVFAGMLAMALTNRRLAARIEESERLAIVGRTMSNVSHCIKNVLQVYQGANMLIRVGVEQHIDESLRSGLALNERATRRLNLLIMDLLDFSRARTLFPRPVEMRDILAQVIEDHAQAPEGVPLRAVIECDVEQATVLDGDRLTRALANLVANSLDVLGDKGGTIRLAARLESERLVIEVSDSGPGVAEEVLDQIFEPFFSTKGSRGTGLGLSMVRRFCEDAGGLVSASLSGDLGGLCVRLDLPLELAGEHETHS